MDTLLKIVNRQQGRLDHVFQKSALIFKCFWGMPWYLKYIAITTSLILFKAASYFTKSELYTNIPFASFFFKEWFILNNILFLLHIAAAIPAVICGPYLIDTKTRKKYPQVHKKLGKLYCFGCMFSALIAIPLSINNHPGTLAPYGFTCMAITWFTTTYFSYMSAINQDFIAHRRWILRSYAMTYAFVHVNFTYNLLPFYQHLSVDIQKVMQSMISWQANLLFIEVFLLLTTFKGRFIGFKNFKSCLHLYSPEDKLYLSPIPYKS
tara:strand:- start:114 stop:908 length:795 start_codon:yes stop_codon:yes gene_type:complete